MSMLRTKLYLLMTVALVSLFFLLGPVAASAGEHSIVFIDAGVPDAQLLAEGVRPGTEVVRLSAGGDGVEQMAAFLAGKSDLDAVHVISHGASGVLRLGALTLTSRNLQNHAADLATIGNALKRDGDILLYGCNVARGAAGRQFIAAIAHATGAVVAASTDPTGAASLGGNWDLEASTGTVTVAHLSFGEGYRALLDVAYDLTRFGTINSSGTSVSDSYFTFTGHELNGDNSNIINVDSYGVYLDINGTNTSTQGTIDITPVVGGGVFTIKSVTVGVYPGPSYSYTFSIRLDNNATPVATFTVNSSSYDSIDANGNYSKTFTLTPTSVSAVHVDITQGSSGGGVGNSTSLTGFVVADYPALPPTPAVTGISPTSGPTAGGTSVIITGTGLSGASAVKFGANNATSYTVDSASQITATAPAGTAGTVDVTVTTAGGTSATTASDQFTYLAPPTVTTGAASGITAGGATLNGTVNANGVSSTVTFDYGTTVSYGSSVTAAQSPVTGAVATAVSAAVSGLTCNTAYHFRAKAVSSGGTVTGSDQTFTTGACNVAPTFVGATTALTVNQNAPATDITGLLHVSDTDSGQTETWSQSAPPSHGALSFVGATASSGATDIAPGGTITYTPAAGYAGSDSFTVQVSDGAATATRTITVTVLAPPTVTDANIGISGATGTGGAYRIGDTVTATWNNTAGGDNNAGISGVTVDFSQFGGGAAVAATNSGGSWTATYTLVAGAIDASNRNVSVTATNSAGSTTTADTTNAIVDTIAPTVTVANISINGATGTGGAYRIGDTVTATWNNTAGGDNNSDTISSVTVDFSQFGGGSAVAATNSAGSWTATYTLVAGAIDATNRNVSVTASDNAGNSTTTAATSNATVDTIAPTVTDARISISGATGSGGAYRIGDTVTATWNDTASGDNNSDTISGVTVDFSQFGGGSAVAATNSAGSWTASYTLVAGAIDGPNKNVAVTATDNAGNSTTTADTSNATVDTIAPTVTAANISISGATGTGGAFKIGDTVTATWNNTAGGDNNSDTISSVTVDFSQFGGGSAVAATNSAGSWTATYALVAGAIDATNRNVSVTASDNAGNSTTTADTSNATVDTIAPTVTAAHIGISGATGSGGTFKIGDTVIATWDNTAGGDNNADISGVTVDFSQFGGGAAVAATNSGGSWSATYVIAAGALNSATNRNVAVTASDNAGNTTTAAGSSNATVDNVSPTVTTVTVPANGSYTAGQNLDFTVSFSENVTVTGTDSTLGLTVGATPRTAAYLAKTATGITYRYTVQSGDLDSDGIAVGALALNTGTITDVAGNSADLTLHGVGATTGVLVDSLIPIATAATAVTASGFSATWGAVTGAGGYYLDVATDSGFTSPVAGYTNKDVGNVTTAAVSGLAATTTYYYRVRAYNGSGTSGSSNIISQLTAPAAPTASAASAVTFSGFTANWNSASGASGYKLDVATDSGFTSPVAGYANKDVGNVTTAAVSGLTANTPYYYRVRAYNSGGTGADSNTVAVTTATTRVVTTTNDSGAGSLRQAILDANPGDAVTFAGGLNGQTITLVSSLTIDKDLTISGPGAGQLTLSGGNAVQLFQVAAGTSFTLEKLTLADGSAVTGGALSDNATATTAISGCVFSGNSATATGGAISAAGTITVSDTLFRNNSAASGGAIATGATLSLTNVTISDNSATAQGGGIANSGGAATLVNVTVANNNATTLGGGIAVAGGTLAIKNSIVAGNSAATGPDIAGTVTSQGYNLIQDSAGATITGDSTGNLTGQDPLLGTLADNGGPTMTMALLNNSPAIDAGDCTGAPTADQRGLSRPQNGSCDMGAYERGLPASLTATGGSGQLAPPTVAFAAPLTAAVADALGGPLDGVTVTFTGPASGASIAANGSATSDAAGSAAYGVAANGTPGSYTVTASVASLTATYTLTNGTLDQSITFTPPATATYGDAPLALSATATSGLPVSFSLTSGPASLSGNLLTITGAGSIVVTATQAGNATYSAAPAVQRTIVVGKAGQTISFGTAPSVVVNGSGTVSATATSGLAVAFTSTTPAVCTVSGTTVSGLTAGTCTVAANQPGSVNYNPALQVTQSITVGKGSQTISFGAAPTLTVNGSGTVSATATSGLAVAFTSTTPAVCTVSGTTVSGLTAGTCTIAADQAGNSNYNPAPQATQSITVGKGSQTISFGAAPSVVVNGTATVSATATSGLTVGFTSTTPAVCSVTGTTVSGLTAGTCTIAANQPGDSNYTAAPPATQSISIGKGSQTISFGSTPSLTVGGTATVSATATSGLTVAFSSTTPTVCTVSGTTVTGKALGTCTIAANQAGDANYSSAPQVTQSITVVYGTTPPTTTLSTLSNNAVTTVTTQNVSGIARDPAGIRSVTVNGVAVTVNADGSFSYPVQLVAGANTVTVVVTNNAGVSSTTSRTITLDATAPQLTVATPDDNAVTYQQNIAVSGSISPLDATTVVSWSVNGATPQLAALTASGYAFTATLQNGQNTILITATNGAGQTVEIKRTVTLATAFSLAVSDPAADIRTVLGSYTLAGTVADNTTPVAVTVSVNGQSYTPAVVNGSFQQPLTFSEAKVYQVAVTGVDQNNTSVTVQRNIIYTLPTATDTAKLTVVDALQALRMTVGIIQPDTSQLTRLDVAPMVNGISVGDGKVDISDVIVILRMAIGAIH
ncbi:fibronectin type III [Geotalea uraniireducens]|uniref:Fibronectin type III n=1 Tax=Geotalea uraniireducens TaxID=351604 RepID=A0ABM8EPM6_9BACT|nr:DUF4347 domain-containing protein [Geotalea uraniireducens]BDV44551.1 fibronectin type III [Geotalea uraniireducens]